MSSLKQSSIPDSKTRLKELKDKIMGIDLCIKDASQKIHNYKQNNTNSLFIRDPIPSSSLLSTPSLLISSPLRQQQNYELYTDPLSRPVLETTMKIIDEREKAAKIAYETFDDMTRRIDKIKLDEERNLQTDIEKHIQDSQMEKHKAKEEYERTLRIIDNELKNKIIQAKMESQQKLEQRIKALQEELQSVYVESGIDTLNIKKSIEEKLKKSTSMDILGSATKLANHHLDFASKSLSSLAYFDKSPNQNAKLSSSLSTTNKIKNFTPTSTKFAYPASTKEKLFDSKLEEIQVSIQNLKNKYKSTFPNGSNEKSGTKPVKFSSNYSTPDEKPIFEKLEKSFESSGSEVEDKSEQMDYSKRTTPKMQGILKNKGYISFTRHDLQ